MSTLKNKLKEKLDQRIDTEIPALSPTLAGGVHSLITPGYLMLDVHDIIPDPDQPRKAFDEAGIRELADTLKHRGLISPVIVRRAPDGKFMLVSGERRWRAAQDAGLDRIAAIFRDQEDQDSFIDSLIENLQREDLNPIDEGEALMRIMDTYGYSQDELARIIGKSRPYIAHTTHILRLPEEIKDFVRRRTISKKHAEILISVEDKAQMLKLAKMVVDQDLTTAALRRIIEATPKARIVRPRKVKPDHITAFEQQVSEQIAMPVRVCLGQKTNTVIIEWKTDEDLARIRGIFG